MKKISVKKSIRLLMASLLRRDLPCWVLCPGSRNAPIVLSAVELWGEELNNGYGTLSVLDERSAGFIAMGMVEGSRRPVAVCCTSGSALLNLAPSVAEAYYRHVNLVIISADRPKRWIGQMDGQTLPQEDVFGELVCKSVSLPEQIVTKEDEWYCQRLIDEAFVAAANHGGGPIHINVPLNEPLFEMEEVELPVINPVSLYRLTVKSEDNALDELLLQWMKERKRCMIVIGQRVPDESTEQANVLLSELSGMHHLTIVAEHLGNAAVVDSLITKADDILDIWQEEEALLPDCLITLGGHIVSKRLKAFLRKAPESMQHLHVSVGGDFCDTYQHLSGVVCAEEVAFLERLLEIARKNAEYTSMANTECDAYRQNWLQKQLRVVEHQDKFLENDFMNWPTDDRILHCLIKKLPECCALHVANSTVVRNLQHFDLPKHTRVFCNRGVNGIEGSYSLALGYAWAHPDIPTYLLIGDLSFMYDYNACGNCSLPKNLKIALFNNRGGDIFHQLPGLEMTDICKRYVAGSKQMDETYDNLHLPIDSYTFIGDKEWNQQIEKFLWGDDNIGLLEIETETATNMQEKKARKEWMYRLRD